MFFSLIQNSIKENKKRKNNEASFLIEQKEITACHSNSLFYEIIFTSTYIPFSSFSFVYSLLHTFSDYVFVTRILKLYDSLIPYLGNTHFRL